MVLIIIFVIYLLGMLIYTKWLYSVSLKYYEPLKIKKDGKIVDVHEMYNEFQLQDKLSFGRLLIGNLTLLPLKLILGIAIALILNNRLK